MTGTGQIRFDFAFQRPYRLPLALLGVRPATAWVEVDGERLTIRFGPWRLRTVLSNVVGTERTGPYRWWRVIGPHVSLADGGISFGTCTTRGLCIRFGDPVPALVPARWPRHRGVTVTVADPDALVAHLPAHLSTP